MAETLLELAGISKTYPGVRALDDVSLRVYRGEVLGLIGENGAGKSTLMRVLGGVVAPSEGMISIGGDEHARMTVNGATRAGIAFVHQELNLFDNLDVAANVFFGREQRSFGLLQLVDTAAMLARTRPLLERLGADFEPDVSIQAEPVNQGDVNLRVSGRELRDLGFYLALGTMKIAVILEGVHARYLAGQGAGPGYDAVGAAVPTLVARSLRQLRAAVM